MNNMKDYRKLIKEGFVFTDQVFSYFDTENSKNLKDGNSSDWVVRPHARS